MARELGGERLLLVQYVREGKYSLTLVYRHFGSWSKVVVAAGLAASRYRPRVTDRALFENLEKLWRGLGRQPTCMDLVWPGSAFGLTPYQRRFGGFQAAVAAFVEWTREGRVSVEKKEHKTTRCVNWRMRYQVLQLDGFKCRSCGRSPATEAGVRLQVDHILAWSRGGETVAGNLQTLCERCNGGTSDL